MTITRTISILSYITALITISITIIPKIDLNFVNIITSGYLVFLLSYFYFVCFFILYDILSVFIDNTTFIFIYLKELITTKIKTMSTLEKIVNFTLLFSALGLIQKLTALDINETTSLGQTIYAWLFVPINLIGIYIGIRYILPLLLRLIFIGSEKVILESPDSAENLWLKANNVMKKNIANKKIEKTRFKLKTVDGERFNTHNNKL